MGNSPLYKVGDKVEAFSNGQWYETTITEVKYDGVADAKYAIAVRGSTRYPELHIRHPPDSEMWGGGQMFHPNDHVELHSLLKAAQLNGSTGTVLLQQFDLSNSRYMVKLDTPRPDGCNDIIAIKPVNLKLMMILNPELVQEHNSPDLKGVTLSPPGTDDYKILHSKPGWDPQCAIAKARREARKASAQSQAEERFPSSSPKHQPPTLPSKPSQEARRLGAAAPCPPAMHPCVAALGGLLILVGLAYLFWRRMLQPRREPHIRRKDMPQRPSSHDELRLGHRGP